MKTTLLKSLRLEARNWWYQPNDVVQRRRQHHRSLRDDLRTIRTAKLATIGRGGSTVYLNNQSRLTAHWEMPILQHLACPVVDLRTIPDDKIVRFAVSGPMVKVDLTEDEGTGAFDYVTIETYVSLAKELGATCRNC